MAPARVLVFFQVSHHALGHKDNMGGELVTKLKASTLHPSLFDKDR